MPPLTPPAVPTPQFFVSQKRGEICELRQLLQSLSADSNNNFNEIEIRNKRRDVLKRLVAYMTLGVDVSPLFPELIMASATTDPIQKKLISLYLSNYAESNPELSILAINTFQKDLSDYDPRIRGLALRALTSLRVNAVLEYSESAISKCLNDPSPYVVRIALLSFSKLIPFGNLSCLLGDNANSILESKIINSEPQFAIHALLSLNEIHQGYQVSVPNAISLANRLEGFNTFGRIFILALLADYVPISEDETFGILNVLDQQLQINSPGILMACLKVALRVSSLRPGSSAVDLTLSCLRRVLPHLLTTLGAASQPLMYPILLQIKQILSLNEIYSSPFAENWEMFIPRLADENYNIILKLWILNKCLTEENAPCVISALDFFLCSPSSLSVPIVSAALRLLGNIALKYSDLCHQLVPKFLDVLGLGMAGPTSACLRILYPFLKSCPEVTSQFVSVLEYTVVAVSESLPIDSLRHLIWVTSSFPELAQCCIRLLESILVSEFQFDLNSETQNNQNNVPNNNLNNKINNYETGQLLYMDCLVAAFRLFFIDSKSASDLIQQIINKIKTTPISISLVDRFKTLEKTLSNPSLFASVFSPTAQQPKNNNHSVDLMESIKTPQCSFSAMNTLAAVCDKHSWTASVMLVPPFGALCRIADERILPQRDETPTKKSTTKKKILSQDLVDNL